MLKFSLRCSQDHGFEGWFGDNAAFEQQAKRGLIDCPICGDARIEKAIMAPHVARRDRARVEPAQAERSPEVASVPSAPNVAPKPAHMPVASLSAEDRALRDMVRAMRQHLVESADHVGPRFAEEALQMHYGEIEHRPIYGSATPDDARMLAEEGVSFHPLPVLPDERN